MVGSHGVVVSGGYDFVVGEPFAGAGVCVTGTSLGSRVLRVGR